MVFCSMAEFFIQYKNIWFGMKTVFREACKSLNEVAQKRGKHIEFLAKQSVPGAHDPDTVEDFATPDQQVPTWQWATGLIVTLAVTMIICAVQFVSSLRDQKL
jgi:hypothetical protein